MLFALTGYALSHKDKEFIYEIFKEKPNDQTTTASIKAMSQDQTTVKNDSMINGGKNCDLNSKYIYLRNLDKIRKQEQHKRV